MKKDDKINDKTRMSLYLDSNVVQWIANKAEEMSINETAYARMLIMKAYKDAGNG